MEGAGHAPRDAVERKLVGLFEELLEARPIGIHDSFFDLGGHSLLAVRLARRIKETFAGEVPLVRVVQRPTVAQLADALREQEPPKKQHRSPALVELKSGSTGAPFFLVPGGHGGMVEMILYARVLGRLRGDRPMYGLLARGLDSKAPPHASAEEMARSYIEDIRTVQPRGPYALGGECIGGAVAFEMAQQLRARGEEVSLLLLLSSWCPSPAARRHYEWLERPRVILEDRLSVAREALADMRGVLKDQLRALRGIDSTQRRAQVKDSVKNVARATRKWLVTLSKYELPMPGQSAEAERNYVKVLVRYRPRPYPGPITLVADEESIAHGMARQWERWAHGGLTVHRVPGTHENYLREVQDETLERLRILLAEAPL
jgi:thioesterase domain-containing protein